MVTSAASARIIRSPWPTNVIDGDHSGVIRTMELTQDLLLPILLAAIVANTAILALLVAARRLGRGHRVAAVAGRTAVIDRASSTSYAEYGARAAWPTDDAPQTPAPTAGPDATSTIEPASAVDLELVDEPHAEAPLVATADRDTDTRDGHDALTGLMDASAFNRRVQDEEARLHRYHRPATVVIFELEGLDRLVGRLGPEAADRVVPAVADTIRRLARASDHVARLAPGRFAVLLTDTDEVAAINYVERVRQACELWLESGAIALRLAIGWAGSTGDPSLPDTQRLATDRMYTELRRVARRSDPMTPEVGIAI